MMQSANTKIPVKDQAARWSLGQHTASPRVVLTGLLLAFNFGLNVTAEIENPLWVWLVLFLGGGLVFAWGVVLIVAVAKKHSVSRLRWLIWEPVFCIVMMAIGDSFAFPLAFPLSRPFLESYVQTQKIPLVSEQHLEVNSRIGLIYVTQVYQETTGQIVLRLPVNMDMHPALVWTPTEQPQRNRSEIPKLFLGEHLGEHWYRTTVKEPHQSEE